MNFAAIVGESLDGFRITVLPVTTEATVMPAMIANGKFPVEKLIHDLIDADDVVAKGFDALSDKGGDKMKILINPQTT